MAAGDITVRGEPGPLVIGARGLEEIVQNVRLILTTLAGDVVLDRRFAGPGEYVDLPVSAVRRRALAYWVEAIERHEPRVRCKGIRWERSDGASDGILYPVVRIVIKEGYIDEFGQPIA